MSRKILIVPAALLVVVIFYGGYALVTKTKLPGASPPNSPSGSDYVAKPPVTASNIWPTSVIKKQKIIAEGEVLKFDSNSITIKGSDNQEAVFKLGSSILVYPPATATGTPIQATHDKAAIRLNQKAVITLEPEGNDYVVKSISYIGKK